MTIAEIEAENPCNQEYCRFLWRVGGPVPSRAYVKREIGDMHPSNEYRKKAERRFRDSAKRSTIRITRRTRIPVQKIFDMSYQWGIWIEQQVLSRFSDRLDRWCKESGRLPIDYDPEDYHDAGDQEGEHEYVPFEPEIEEDDAYYEEDWY